jgi:hypothetical protein
LIGAGIIAGGPYYCAQSQILVATTVCMNATPEPPSAPFLAAETVDLAAFGFIDSPSHLQSHRTYLFSGTGDTVVRQPVMLSLMQYYEQFVTNRGNIKSVFNVPSEHAMITYTYGNNCSDLGEPYINHCNAPYKIQLAHEVLKHIYPNLKYTDSAKETNRSNVFEFDQYQFISSGYGLQKLGYVYIPTRCQNPSSPTKCSIHVAFHGCLQGYHFVGDQFIMHAGYNDVAELNNIIVIYPQVAPSDIPLNPKGCFDWFGYTSFTEYHVKHGPQMNAIKRMIQFFGADYFDR